MPTSLRCLIADAATPADLPLALPQLQRLLASLVAQAPTTLPSDCPALPDECLAAQWLGLPATPGHIPWAAYETTTWDQPCAWLHLCHLQLGMDHGLMHDPAQLQLDADTSRQLLTVMAPYFAEDGISLREIRPGAWLASGEVFRDLATVSLRRVIDQAIDPWLSAAGDAVGATLRRLHSEMQMLLYTLPLNDERVARGLPLVNSFWLSGAGQLPRPAEAAPPLLIERRLQGLQGSQRQQVWSLIDADLGARLLAAQAQGDAVTVSFCGAWAAQTWAPIAAARRRWPQWPWHKQHLASDLAKL